jgi:hypothetical protein
MRSGDPCPRCSAGRLVVYSTKRLARTEADLVKGYLRCDLCGVAVGVQIVPRRVPLKERRKLLLESGKPKS